MVPALKIPSRIRTVAITILFLTFLAGQFSLGRIGQAYGSFGIFGEPRIIMLFVLAVFALPLAFKSYNKNDITRHLKDRNISLWLFLLIIVFAYMCISVMWSKEAAYARDNALSVLLLAVMMLFTYAITRNETIESIDLFLLLFFIAAIIYAIGGLAGFGFWDFRGRIAFLWGGSNGYVRIVSTGLIIALYFWEVTKRKIFLIFIPLLFLTALLSGSRGGVISLLIIMPLAYVVIIHDYGKRVAFFSLISLTVAVLFFAPFTSSFRTMLENRFPVSRSDLVEKYEHSRKPWFSKSLDALDDETLLGVGIGGLQAYGINYSHNIVLNFAAEGGALGLILLLLTALPLIFRLSRYRSLQTNVCLLLGLFYLLTSMFSGSYFDQRFMWLFFLFYMYPSLQQDEPAASGNSYFESDMA